MNRLLPLHNPTTTAMSGRPLSLDLHRRYNNINSSNHHHINFRDRSYYSSSTTSATPSSKVMNRNLISLDNTSDEEEAEFCGIDLDDITTTSGSELLANEAYSASKRNGRKYGPQTSHNYPISNDSSDSENDFYQFSNHRRRRHQQQQQSRPLEMIQEISPVLPDNNDSDNDSELPPRMPLRYTKEFNPLQTSTLLSLQHLPQHHHQQQQQFSQQQFHHQQFQQQQQHPQFHPQQIYHHPRPITNPHHSGPTTPSSYNPISLDGDQRIPSLFENHHPQRPISSDHYGLSTMLATKFNSNGILYLEISILKNILFVKIRNANFYFDKSFHGQVNSFVKVETKPNPDKRRRRRHDNDRFESFKTQIIKRNNAPHYFQTFDFKIRSRNREALDFLSISVYTVEESPSGAVCNLLGCMSFPLERLFRKAGIYDRPDYGKRCKRSTHDVLDEATSVIKGGYFLLGEEQGSRGYLAQSKIRKQKYYDDIGASSISISTCSSSPIKMMGETDWRMTTPSQSINRGQQILSRFAESNTFSKSVASSCYNQSSAKNNGGSGIPKKRSSLAGAMINGINSNDLSSPSTSSSSNSSTQNAMLLNGRNVGGGNGGGVCDFSTSNSSSSMSGGIINYNNTKRGGAYKRSTLPSIMTTSDSNSEISEPISFDPVDYHYLYVDEAPIDSMTEEQQHQSKPLRPRQRRNIGSMDSNMPFTHAEEDAEEDYEEEENQNKDDGLRFKKIAVKEIQQDVKKVGHRFGGFHPSVRRVASFTSPPTKTQIAKAAEQHQREQRRGFLGKTLHYLRNKVDGASSQPSLIPTREEVKSWHDKMENIFDSKFGVMMFREFLEKEFSAENLDFLLKCREYQKLFENEKKNAKKIARLAKEIYDDFIAAEIAPKEINIEAQIRTSTKAAVNETLKENTFSLAQKQIQTLIENDKYPRFLKCPEYQNLFQSLTLGSQSSIQSALPELPYTDSDGSSTPCQTGNEDTPLAPQQLSNRTLRSASALETLGPISSINE